MSLLQVVSSRVGVGTILVEGSEVRLANAAAEQMLGHPAHSLKGKPWSTVLPTHVVIDIADPDTASTLGLQLIHSLTRQIRGKVSSDSKGGARFELRCTVPT